MDPLKNIQVTPQLIRSIGLISIVREHGRVTIRDAVKITGANRNTVKDHIRQLMQSGHLSQHGHGKGTWYEKG